MNRIEFCVLLYTESHTMVLTRSQRALEKQRILIDAWNLEHNSRFDYYHHSECQLGYTFVQAILNRLYDNDSKTLDYTARKVYTAMENWKRDSRTVRKIIDDSLMGVGGDPKYCEYIAYSSFAFDLWSDYKTGDNAIEIARAFLDLPAFQTTRCFNEYY